MRLLLTLALTLFLTTGCNLVYKQNIQQGNAIEQEDLDKLRIGMTQNQVAFLLGTPSIRDPFHRDRWDFVSTFSRRGEDAVMRKVTLYFENGLLSEMIGVEGDEFIYEDDEPAAPDAEDEPAESITETDEMAPAEVTPLAAPMAEQSAFGEPSAAEVPAAVAVEDDIPVVGEPSTSMETRAAPEITDVTETTETMSADSDNWVIQLGAFDSDANARGVLDRLEAAGFDAEITEQVSTGSDLRYLVRKSGIESKAEAEQLLDDIANGLGINGFLVPPGG